MADDDETVCCMCGDIGFPDKHFRCNKCLNRFQHSYCSNYYSESKEAAEVSCDWCQNQRGKRCVQTEKGIESGGVSSRRSQNASAGRSQYSPADQRIKQTRAGHESSSIGPSSRHTTARRYKLLKDVMC